ncbi:hypothetical protein MRY87_03815 [bacterium]|nr:hypothetical protein [bacterium]
MLTTLQRRLFASPLRFFPLFVFVLHGCGGGGHSDTIQITPDPTGAWGLRFTEVTDSCDVIAPDDLGTGFDSHQEITSADTHYTISGVHLVLGELCGTLRSDDSLLAEETLTGDIFGTGTECQLSERIAYNHLTPTEAEVLYEVRIDCGTDSRCVSVFRARGEKEE